METEQIPPYPLASRYPHGVAVYTKEGRYLKADRRFIQQEHTPPPVADIYEARAQLARLVNEKNLLIKIMVQGANNA